MSKANQAVMWALLFASGASVATAQQPVTLTSSADFRRGNNEGLTTTAQDRVTRDLITAGTVGGWSSTTGLTGGRAGHCSIVYNGYAYVFSGGNDNFVRVTDVLFTSINADGSVGTWSSTTALPTGRDSFSCVAYNGFVYAIAGSDEPVGRLNE
ncbi:MAG TPA: hypothetical protein VK661_06225, partial [Planctomycetota bacterium]|nr:hypothetical protein [Planctomycetota bacterium]